MKVIHYEHNHQKEIQDKGSVDLSAVSLIYLTAFQISERGECQVLWNISGVHIAL